MSNSPLVEYTQISPHRTSPRTKKIAKITPHHAAGKVSVETMGAIFQNREASANYGIGYDGRIGMYVEEADRPWTSSSGANDNQAVTIECSNSAATDDWPVSDLVLGKLIDLCVDICQRNEIEKLIFTGDASGNLTQHNYFIATACPGPYLKSKFTYIAETVNARLGAEVAVVEEPAASGNITQGSEVVFAGGSVYASSTATQATATRRQSKCKVTIYKNGAPHPCHCISTDDGGVYGWVDLDKCTLINNGAADEEEETGYLVKVTASALNIRKGPGTSYGIVGCIRNKGVYTIVETNNGWGRLKSGVGWIYLSYTTKV